MIYWLKYDNMCHFFLFLFKFLKPQFIDCSSNSWAWGLGGFPWINGHEMEAFAALGMAACVPLNSSIPRIEFHGIFPLF